MSQLLQLTAYEIRLYLRSKTFWLMGGLVILTVIALSISVLLLQYIVINIITRDQRSGFSKILTALPHNTVILFAARVLAVFLLLLGICLVRVIVVGILSGGATDWLANGSHFALLILKYIVTCMTSIGIVFLASLVTQRPWKLYLMVSIWWIMNTIVANYPSYLPSWSKLFLFGYGIMVPGIPSVVVGYFLQQDLLLGFAAFQLPIAILFIILATTRQMARRGERFLQSKIMIVLILLSIVTSSIAGVSIWKEFDRRESQFSLALRETPGSEAAIAQTASEATLELEDYQLDVKLRTAAHYLEGTATIKVKLVDCPSNILYFTLRNCFAVEDVMAGDRGEGLEWWREGSRLAVRLPTRYRQGDSLILSIVYSGQVWEWFNGSSARPNGSVNFVDTSLSLLRSGHAWYPVPGDHPLYTRKYYAKQKIGLPDSTLWAKRALHQPVPFALTVDIDNDSTVASNLEQIGVETLTGDYKQRYRFGALQGRDVFLMTGPYHHEKRHFSGRDDFVEVYSYHEHQSNIDKVVNGLETEYLFYEDMFKPKDLDNFSIHPQGKTCTVVEIPFKFVSDWEGDADITLVNTVLVNDEDFQSSLHWLAAIYGVTDAQVSGRDVAILRCWGQDGSVSGYDGEGDIIDGLGLYLHTLYTEKTQGHVYYEQLKQQLLVEDGKDIGNIPSMIKGPVVRDVFMVLDVIRTSDLNNLYIKRIMHENYQIYARKNHIDSTDFVKIVEAVLSGMDCSPERSDEIHRRLESITQRTNDPEHQKIE